MLKGKIIINLRFLSFTQGNPGLLTMVYDDDQEHCFMDGDWVMFSEIEGMTQLNGSKSKICVKGNRTFFLFPSGLQVSFLLECGTGS